MLGMNTESCELSIACMALRFAVIPAESSRGTAHVAALHSMSAPAVITDCVNNIGPARQLKEFIGIEVEEGLASVQQLLAPRPCGLAHVLMLPALTASHAVCYPAAPCSRF